MSRLQRLRKIGYYALPYQLETKTELYIVLGECEGTHILVKSLRMPFLMVIKLKYCLALSLTKEKGYSMSSLK